MTPEQQSLQALALKYGQSGSAEDLKALLDYTINKLPFDQWPDIECPMTVDDVPSGESIHQCP